MKQSTARSRLGVIYAARSAALLLLLLCNPAAAEFTWVERPDTMHVYFLADYDRLDDRVRVLYQTKPSLQQSRQPGWSVNVYIAELHPDGTVDHRRVLTGQTNYMSLLLRRGHEQIFALPRPESRGDAVPLETRSLADGALIASFSAPELTKAAGTFRPLTPTSDGNVFYARSTPIDSRRKQPNSVIWTKYAPDGTELGRGEWANPTAQVSLNGAFPARDGGIGLTVGLRLIRDVNALETDIDPIMEFEVGGRRLEARVGSETRMLETDAAGQLEWLSPALERGLIWDGDMGIPRELPMEERQAQMAEQMRLTARVELDHAAKRQLEHYAHYGHDEVRLTAEGYGLLADVTGARRLEPPMYGHWFIELDRDGTIIREIRVEPAAERLEANFERFLPTAEGGLLVTGTRETKKPRETFYHLTALDEGGEVQWTARLQAENVQIEGIAGTAENPWVFGQGLNRDLPREQRKTLLWVERVDPESAQRLAAGSESPASAPTPQPRPRAIPDSAGTPSMELPEPAEGCTCSCEEAAAIRELSERMNSASQAEMLAMVADPAFQARMNCMSGCAMEYAKCQ